MSCLVVAVAQAEHPLPPPGGRNASHPIRRRSCVGEKGKTLRGGWDREVSELGGLGVSAAQWLIRTLKDCGKRAGAGKAFRA